MFDEFDKEYSRGWDKLAREFDTKREELLKNCIEKRRKSIEENIKKAKEKEIGRCINCNTLLYENKPHKVGIFPVDGLFPLFCDIDCVKEWHDKNKLTFSEIKETEEEDICLRCNKKVKWEEQFIYPEGILCLDCYKKSVNRDKVTEKIEQILSSGFIEDSRDSYKERAEALLSSEIEPDVTLRDVIEFYFKNRIDTKALSEALLPIARKAQENQEETSKAHRRIWDIIDDCMKKAKENEPNINTNICDICKKEFSSNLHRIHPKRYNDISDYAEKPIYHCKD